MSIPAGLEHLSEDGTITFTKLNWDEAELERLVGAYGALVKRVVLKFDYTSTEDESFKECWALENLQPLWASENISKGSKWKGKIWREKNGRQQHG